MIKIVIIRGGLGNQMFGYAFFLSLKHKFRFSFTFIEPVHCYHVHNGFELPAVFLNVVSVRSYKFYRRLQKAYSEYFTRRLFKKVIEPSPGNYFPDFEKTHFPFLVYEGYWQSDKYFRNLRSTILNIFQFDIKKLNINTLKQGEILKKENSVSVHIRRGDYVGHDELGTVCTLSYYKRAIGYLETVTQNPIYYIFTNDKIWVSDNFSFIKYKLIDWNYSSDSWQDMYLMTKCKHNIIANSSFSWWGAWLNLNENKIVIAPSKWFKSINANDIVPDNWIKI